MRAADRHLRPASQSQQLANVSVDQLYIGIHRRLRRRLPVGEPDRPCDSCAQIIRNQRRIGDSRQSFHGCEIARQGIGSVACSMSHSESRRAPAILGSASGPDTVPLKAMVARPRHEFRGKLVHADDRREIAQIARLNFDVEPLSDHACKVDARVRQYPVRTPQLDRPRFAVIRGRHCTVEGLFRKPAKLSRVAPAAYGCGNWIPVVCPSHRRGRKRCRRKARPLRPRHWPAGANPDFLQLPRKAEVRELPDLRRRRAFRHRAH